jgi:tRNA G10  N-methylase Trm11
MTRRVREPFRQEIVGGKGSIFYRTHSYHTKVPPEGIIPHIEHYTDAGDLVLDPFCGSGMTGVAALLSGRHAILSDLSPAAVHIATGHTHPASLATLGHASKTMMGQLSEMEDHLYGTDCSNCGNRARIEYTVWSDTVECPTCRAHVLFWDAARAADGSVAKVLACPRCSANFSKADAALWPPAPVLVSVDCGYCRVRVTRPLTDAEVASATRSRRSEIQDWFPTTPLEPWREMWRGQHRDMGISTAADFFTDRNLQALAAAWQAVTASSEPAALRFAVTAIINRASRRYQWNPKRPTNVLSGTLYIASLTYEFNVFSLLRRKLRLVRQLAESLTAAPGTCSVQQASATELAHIEDASVDYAFADPPFGANIYYSDASFLWEAWLGTFTPTAQEAVISTSLAPEHGGKSRDDYEVLMASSFGELARVLKRDAWASVMFHNSDDAVWSSLQRAIESAGLQIESATAFDKSQPSFKGIKQITDQERVSSFDLVLQLRAQTAKSKRATMTVADRDAQVIKAIADHLDAAPPRRRTTPYIHSFVMRLLLERGWPLAGQSYTGVETLLAANFSLRDGVWSRASDNNPGSDSPPDTPGGGRPTRRPRRRPPARTIDNEPVDDPTAEVTGAAATASRPIPATASASKGSNAYQVHTYPTKVPPAAIEPFILASTERGGVVLDPFCGSGMTGLAAQNTGRRAILSDLAPGAVHLAHNHTNPVNPEQLAAAMAELTVALADVETTLYQSRCPTCSRPAPLRHVVWTDVHNCEKCGVELPVWDQTDESGSSSRRLICRCGHTQMRSGVSGVVSKPAEKAVACPGCGKLQRGEVSKTDLALLARIERRRITNWVPSVPMGPDREMYRRSALHLRGITDVSDFWNKRSKLALSTLWAYISTTAPADVRPALQFAFTNTAWHATRMRRYNAKGGQRPLTGTLYIPQLVAEGNVFEVFRHQVAQVARFYAGHPALGLDGAAVLTRQSSATELDWLPSASIDYVFTDPPFGANLFYGDCNIVWESWLGDVTQLEKEIVVNRSLPASEGGKTLAEYEKLLSGAFSEISRALRPNARASVVFHNSDDKVWSALLSATDRAGLVQTEVSLLDKVQRSMKGYKGRSGAEMVPFFDLVITFMPGARAPGAHLNGAGEIALSAIRHHLAALSAPSSSDGHEKRGLEYLYSLAVASVIAAGAKPTGLSFRAVEQMLRGNFASEGTRFFL